MSTITHCEVSTEDDPFSEEHLLRFQIEHAAHLLPSQGPITAFVHHNTLHAYDHLPFETAVVEGMNRYGCRPYLPEETYRQYLAAGRIRPVDLEAVLIKDLGEQGDELLGFLGSRYHLRLSMLQHSFCSGTDTEIRWLVEEQAALRKFLAETPTSYLKKAITSTRHWLLAEQQKSLAQQDSRLQGITRDLVREFGGAGSLTRWSETKWESFTLHLLWRICLQGVHGLPRSGGAEAVPVRHRDWLLQATGQDADASVNELLIRYCSAFLDQGFANWKLPVQDCGFFRGFLQFQAREKPVARWLKELPWEARRLLDESYTPLQSIEESLTLLGVSADEQEEFITQTLLALRGWAGMIWQLETNAEWAARPAAAGTLVEYLAVRLLLERLSLRHLAGSLLKRGETLGELRPRLRKQRSRAARGSQEQRAFVLFQLAQFRGWNPVELYQLHKEDWQRLIDETEAFSPLERRRIYQQAYERTFRVRALNALVWHGQRGYELTPQQDISFQVMTCIDDREESIRRHLEEVDPRCVTYGAPGFYAVVMYYQGAADAHYRPLCPNVVKPQHYVQEAPAYSLLASSRQRAENRRTIGAASHHWHLQSRTFLGGIFTALLGSLATVPLVANILFPHATSRWRRLLGSFLTPPPVTELTLARREDPPGPTAAQLGFSRPEKVQIVRKVLQDIGLTENFAPLVLVMGHGSGSLNNPHESAYNCGACSGGRGGPNARAFCQMANDRDVRAELKQQGLLIPEGTFFVGAFHNTCDDNVIYFDLERIPFSHRQRFEKLQDTMDRARALDARERSRRFESAPLEMTPEEALEHVQTRAEDLSQARPEYNHATNSLTVVGRRERTRGLFLDRRAFLNSYNPDTDDAEGTILERILSAAVPVCAGISLEYYFSTVDTVGYGCGSKLPHNIVSLLGVMEGASSDLRPGLSQQMVEIHEPMRMLFIIETTPGKMHSIMQRNQNIGRPIKNRWVHLVLLAPDSQELLYYQDGEFVRFQPETGELPVCRNSAEWYSGQRGHLGFASILSEGGL